MSDQAPLPPTVFAPTHLDLDGAPDAPAPPAVGRFAICGEVGRGGMGLVLRGHDPGLGRDLAVKLLLGAHADRPEAARRFLQEARIGGRLQHPGVVPVYELGQADDGRPFIAMKLVEGDTLADLLRRRAMPADGLPRLLAVFEHVCQTVAYAHSRGVVHRDLKPSNVMVGAFGEALVMDWGLAKCLDEGADDAARGRPAAGPSDARGTVAGSVAGTPAYMAPEQARGEAADQRADVFGLGAVLCEILTGLPPFAEADGLSALRRAADGDLSDAFARLAGCGADAELVALARDCLAANREGRPEGGAAVAARLAAYQAGARDRLRAAELERAAAQARARAERRARRLTLGLSAAVLLTLALGGGGLAWERQKRLRNEADRRQQEADLARQAEDDLARAALAQERKRWPDAWQALERAEGRLAGGGPEELRERVALLRRELEQARKDQRMLALLEEARLQAARGGKDGFDWTGTDRRYRKAFAEYGLDLWDGTPQEAAGHISRSPIREALVAALDEWMLALYFQDAPASRRLRQIAGLADGDAWRRGLRTAVWGSDLDTLRRLAREARSRHLPPGTLKSLAGALAFHGMPELALEVLRAGQRQHPTDFWLTFELADTSMDVAPPQPDQAVRFFTAALALRPGSPVVINDLGNALRELGRLDEAEEDHREAIRLKPDFARAHSDLGRTLRRKGDLAAAEAASRDGVRLSPDNPWCHNDLALVLMDRNRPHEAEAAMRTAVRLRPDIGLLRCNLGLALRAEGRFNDSLAAFCRGRDLMAGMRQGNYPFDRWVSEAERLVELDRRVEAVLRGDDRPADEKEELEFLQLLQYKRWFAAATRYAAGLFDTRPAVAGDVSRPVRYNAACFAALAGCGEGDDPDRPDDAERARLRRRALEWLRADLDAWSKRPGAPARRMMRHWQQDDDLAGVRDAPGLTRLPPDEQAEWCRLWAAVAALERAGGP
jgi:serine/threonine-protein kinase